MNNRTPYQLWISEMMHNTGDNAAFQGVEDNSIVSQLNLLITSLSHKHIYTLFCVLYMPRTQQCHHRIEGFDDAGVRAIYSCGSRWVCHKLNVMKRVLSKLSAYTSHIAALSVKITW